MNLALALPAPLSLRRRRDEAVVEHAASIVSEPGRFNRHLLNIEFEGPGGEQWSSVGGGETVVDAIAAAREALPLGVEWDVVRWNELYGD